MIYYSIFEHSFSNIMLFSSELGLKHVSFCDTTLPNYQVEQSFLGSKAIYNLEKHDEIHRQLQQYFDGIITAFSVQLDLDGTPFQKHVWNEIHKIPYGQTITYSEIARHIGNSQASRAVGGATGKNPVPIIIPCHRVIGANGRLTGFSALGGIALKEKLLNLEGVHQVENHSKSTNQPKIRNRK